MSNISGISSRMQNRSISRQASSSSMKNAQARFLLNIYIYIYIYIYLRADFRTLLP